MNNSMIYVENQALVERFYAELAPNARWDDAVLALKEEIAELFEAIDDLDAIDEYDWDSIAGQANRAYLAKEIGDAAFTLRGIALKAGIDFDAAERIVAIDNVTNKVRAESGKVQKKIDYHTPDMGSALL